MSEGRECPLCPAWVVRCAHWEGKVLVIARSIRRGGRRFPLSGLHPKVRFDYSVVSGMFEDCVCCGTEKALFPVDQAFDTDDLPAAEAEFARREAALLEETRG